SKIRSRRRLRKGSVRTSVLRKRSSSVRQVWQVRHTEPEVAALAVEEPEEDGDEGGEVEPEAEHPERPAGADDRPDEQGEILAEEPGEERERQEERRDPTELLHREVHPVPDRRLVQVGDAGGEVAVVVQLFGHADQMVVD